MSRRPRVWPPALLVALAAAAWFGYDLASEPHFVDESAYISQAYFADLLVEGRRDDPLWLEYPGYDLPPLPKYLIGLALRAAGEPRSAPAAARAWYRDTSTRPESAAMLLAARWPSVLLGALGCVSAYGLGVLAHGRLAGLLAAGLLAVDPLYRMHARRAMSDVPAEALILATAAVGLWAWRQTLARGFGPAALLASILAGLLGGLATLAKLNGALGLMTLLAWAVLAAPLARFPVGRRLAVVGSALVSGAVGFAAFAALNPFLTARPTVSLPTALEEIARAGFWGRVRRVAEHRAGVSDDARTQFPHNALSTFRERAEAVAVQGFGRFGPLGPARTDSTIRFDPRQDRGAVIWGPIVLLGALAAWLVGSRQARDGEPPTAWAVLAYAALALAVVTAFIPLAWDRYYLSIQAGSALLGAILVASTLGAVVGLGRARPAAPESAVEAEPAGAAP